MTANALVIQGSPAQRLPTSVVVSIGLHGAILGLLMYTATSKKETTRVISNVDLMIQVKKPVDMPKPVPKSQSPASTWNFLKMALPAAPRLQQMDVKVPERKSLMTAQPKLEERNRKDLPKLESLDLNKQRPELNALDAKVEDRRASAAKALAAMPKLEEIGRRQVRNLPQALKMEEERQQAMGLQGMNALSDRSGRAASAAPMGEPLQDAGKSASRFSDKIASMLPAEGGLAERGRAAAAPQGVKQVVQEPAVVKRQAAQAMTETKKGVSIEGPLSNRKVVAYDIPEFPKWARDQGVLEAQVAIRFWVDPAGNVLPNNMRVEHTSGYGQLDRTAMEALKNWKFAPLTDNQRQWGVITFRFVLE